MSRAPHQYEQSPAASRGDVACYLLLHGGAERPSLAKAIGCSKASITHHCRWLIEQNLITGEPQRRAHSKRPVDWLELNGDALTAIPIQLLEDRVTGEVVALDGTVLKKMQQPLAAETQRAVLECIEHVANEGLAYAHEQGRQVDMFGLSVRGVINPWASMVNSVIGISEWQTCQPMMIAPSLRTPEFHSRPAMLCPRQTAKLRGFAQEHQKDDQVAYICRKAGLFRLASFIGGRIAYGGTGAEHQCTHISVADHGPACYCGRKGCLLQLLQRGADHPELFAEHLVDMINRHIHCKTIGFEWDGDLAPIREKLAEHDIETFSPENPNELATIGVRLLTLQALVRTHIDTAILNAPQRGMGLHNYVGELHERIELH